MANPSIPSVGNILPSIRASCHSIRLSTNIRVDPEAIKALLTSPLFTATFQSLKTSHGVALPLNFSSPAAELNLIAILSLLNFGHSYRVPLHTTIQRGAYDSIRAFVFALYLSSSSGQDWLSAKGMKTINGAQVAEFCQLTEHVHQEKPHKDIPGVVMGELGGPLWDFVEGLRKVLNETGEVLVGAGYKDLGGFVIEALKEGERVGKRAGRGVDAETVLDQVLRAIPAFRGMAILNGEPVYVFKKALFLLQALTDRFGALRPPPFPLPSTDTLPIFSDNVIPSMLVHFGVLDLSSSTLPRLRTAYPSLQVADNLAYVPPETRSTKAKGEPPRPGPELSKDEAYALRAAAVDACEVIVSAAKQLESLEQWTKEITLPEIDAWLWSVAKVGKLRELDRFAEMGTVFY